MASLRVWNRSPAMRLNKADVEFVGESSHQRLDGSKVADLGGGCCYVFVSVDREKVGRVSPVGVDHFQGVGKIVLALPVERDAFGQRFERPEELTAIGHFLIGAKSVKELFPELHAAVIRRVALARREFMVKNRLGEFLQGTDVVRERGGLDGHAGCGCSGRWRCWQADSSGIAHTSRCSDGAAGFNPRRKPEKRRRLCRRRESG